MPDYPLKIRRFDPESGEPAYWADYQVELPPERSVLDAILQVKDREDASIGIRCSCRAAICGSCAVRINGRSALACNTRIADAAEQGRDGAVTIEPMGNMPVLKDLITDMEAVHWKKVRRVVPWLLPDEEPPELITVDAGVPLVSQGDRISIRFRVADGGSGLPADP